jgi:hypothetical protein
MTKKIDAFLLWTGILPKYQKSDTYMGLMRHTLRQTRCFIPDGWGTTKSLAVVPHIGFCVDAQLLSCCPSRSIDSKGDLVTLCRGGCFG